MIVMLLPELDFDPTESSLPWSALVDAGREVRFATPTGRVAHADERLVKTGFGLLSPLLMTKKDALEAYARMEASAQFRSPLRYDDVDPSAVDLLLVPGGHAPGMKTMLESDAAKRIVVEQFRKGGKVAAVCHGVLLLARAIDPSTGRSVLHGRKTTALPKSMELSAWALTKPFLGDYYRTYPETVQDEVTRALAAPTDFLSGPLFATRDRDDHANGFVVRDSAYVSARWPGDCHTFARACVSLVVHGASQRANLPATA